jgi:hypothetical protein
MTFKGLEDFDDFDTESIYWVDVSGIPERFVNEAKGIDGDDYSGECFGVCIQHNRETGEFAVIEDSPGHSLYYVDNLGYKHWLAYRLSGQELEKIVSKIHMFIEKECRQK